MGNNSSQDKMTTGIAYLVIFAIILINVVIVIVKLIIVFILIILESLVIFLPLLVSLSGFINEKEDRLVFGIISILSGIYLILDYHFNWFINQSIYGLQDRSNFLTILKSGFLSFYTPYINYFIIADCIGIVLAIIFIFQSSKTK